MAARDLKAKVSTRQLALLARVVSRRGKQTVKRRARETKILFRRVRTVNGTVTMQQMDRNGVGSVKDDDFSLDLSVYVPENQRYFRFHIPDAMFRDYLYQVSSPRHAFSFFLSSSSSFFLTEGLCACLLAVPTFAKPLCKSEV